MGWEINGWMLRRRFYGTWLQACKGVRSIDSHLPMTQSMGTRPNTLSLRSHTSWRDIKPLQLISVYILLTSALFFFYIFLCSVEKTWVSRLTNMFTFLRPVYSLIVARSVLPDWYTSVCMDWGHHSWANNLIPTRPWRNSSRKKAFLHAMHNNIYTRLNGRNGSIHFQDILSKMRLLHGNRV